MRKSMKFAVVVCLVFLLSFPVCATEKDIGQEESPKFNVAMVIDGSRSLAKKGGTDVNGLRYDAMDLFLGLLTQKGNSVGTIVFNKDIVLDTGIADVSTKKDKTTLSEQIRNTSTAYGTDIGEAMSQAVKEVSEATKKNGKPSVIIFFSDGETELKDKKERKQSLEQKNAAVKLAKEEEIPVYSICLNASGQANTTEMKDIAAQTKGEYIEVRNAKDLNEVIEQYYALIYSAGTISSDEKFDKNGILEKSFRVPSVGIEEVNIIIKTKKKVSDISLSRPTGVIEDKNSLQDMLTSTSTYQLLKIPEPENGVWKLKLLGDPNTDVDFKLVYNSSLSVKLKSGQDIDNIKLDEPVSMNAKVTLAGKEIKDSSAYADYKAKLILSNIATGEKQEVEMTYSDSGFTVPLTFKEYGSYYVTAQLVCDSLEYTSNSLGIDVGNKPPTAKENLVEMKISAFPFGKMIKSIDLSEYISDQEDKKLNYQIGTTSYGKNEVAVDGQNLKVNYGKQKTGDVEIIATDSMGATCNVTFQITYENMLVRILVAAVTLIILAVFITLIRKIRRNNLVFNGFVTVESFNQDTNNNSAPYTKETPKGRTPLSEFNVQQCGINIQNAGFYIEKQPKSKFGIPVFYSKSAVYYNGAWVKEIRMQNGSSVTIYADENMRMGIRVSVKELY